MLGWTSDRTWCLWVRSWVMHGDVARTAEAEEDLMRWHVRSRAPDASGHKEGASGALCKWPDATLMVSPVIPSVHQVAGSVARASARADSARARQVLDQHVRSSLIAGTESFDRWGSMVSIWRWGHVVADVRLDVGVGASYYPEQCVRSFRGSRQLESQWLCFMGASI
jgi:hypothetical protein